MNERTHGNERAPFTAARIRRWLVIRLIRAADRGWTASYYSYMRCKEDGFPSWYHDFWTWWANRIDHVARRLARLIDKDNRWTGAEMAEHGWWG